MIKGNRNKLRRPTNNLIVVTFLDITWKRGCTTLDRPPCSSAHHALGWQLTRHDLKQWYLNKKIVIKLKMSQVLHALRLTKYIFCLIKTEIACLIRFKYFFGSYRLENIFLWNIALKMFFCEISAWKCFFGNYRFENIFLWFIV